MNENPGCLPSSEQPAEAPTPRQTRKLRVATGGKGQKGTVITVVIKSRGKIS